VYAGVSAAGDEDSRNSRFGREAALSGSRRAEWGLRATQGGRILPRVKRLLVIAVAVALLAGCAGSGDSTGSTVREVVVPNVTGKPVAEARAAIEAAGLTPAVQRARQSVFPVGRVFYMEEPAGSKLREGTTVVIWVTGGPAQPASEPAAPTSPPPPHLRRQRYDRAVAALDRKCNEDSSLIARYIRKAQDLLQESGQYESLASIATHVNRSDPAGLPVTDCSQLFAAYGPPRQAGG
jgi:PASTA domain